MLLATAATTLVPQSCVTAATSSAVSHARHERCASLISPLTLAALLFHDSRDVYAEKGESFDPPLDVVRVAIPLALYFGIMFAVSLVISALTGATLPRAVALSFAAASNNFELAIAVAFGISSG